MQGATVIVFTGQFRVESFVEFVNHRARRLQIDAVVEAATPDRIEVAVSGQPALVDAHLSSTLHWSPHFVQSV